MAKDKSFSVAGGLGFQGYNTKNYMGKATARTGTDTTAATRDQFYGGASTPKKPAANPGMISFPGTATKMLKQKFTTKYTPGEYAAYRKKTVAKKAVAKPAAVVSNVTNAKMSPVKNSSVSSRMAVNPRTGNTTGFTTGKTTGSSVSKPGVATKTYQSAGDRLKANTERRFGVAGPTGGGSSSRSSSGGSSRSTSSGGNFGGAAGRGEPRGSKK